MSQVTINAFVSTENRRRHEDARRHQELLDAMSSKEDI